MNNGIKNSNNIAQWLNRALFNTDSANQYFETFVAGVDPLWSLTETKAMVEKVHVETNDTITITLRPNSRFKGFQAGQHVQVTFDIEGKRKTRTFSISSCPSDFETSKLLQLTVKAVINGEVTQWVHHHLKPTSIVTLSKAQGEFTLPETNQGVLYIAGGSGITPIMSHIRQLLDTNPNQNLSLLYYGHANEFIFEHELKAISKRLKSFKCYFVDTKGESNLSNLSGYINPSHIERACKKTPDVVFLCGPNALQENASDAIKSTFGDSTKIVQEYFGLVIRPSKDTSQAQPIVFNQSKTQIDCDQNTSLLDAAIQAGLSPNHGCKMGICYTCKCKKKSGIVRNLITGELSSNEEEDIQLCISAPESHTILDI